MKIAERTIPAALMADLHKALKMEYPGLIVMFSFLGAWPSGSFTKQEFGGKYHGFVVRGKTK